jgi:hypothetical protein
MPEKFVKINGTNEVNIEINATGDTTIFLPPQGGTLALNNAVHSLVVSNTTYASGQISFQNSNGFSFASSAGQNIFASHDLQYTSNTSAITSAAVHTSASRVMNIVAATNNTGGGAVSMSSNVSFSNANNFTFYTSAGNAIVGSFSTSQSNQNISLYAVGNTSGPPDVSSVLINASAFSIRGGNNITVNVSNSQINIAGGAGGAGATSYEVKVNGGSLDTNVATYYDFQDNANIAWNLSPTGAIQGNVNYPSQTVDTGKAGTGFTSAGAGIGLSGTLNTNGLSLSATVNGGATYTRYNEFKESPLITGQQGQSTLHIQPWNFPNLTWDRVVHQIFFTGASNTTVSVTMSMFVGLYTKNISTLSLLMSASSSQGITHSASNNSTVNVGFKHFTQGWSSSVSEGQYYVAILSKTASAGANSATLSQLLNSIAYSNTNFAGLWGVSSNTSNQLTIGLGIYSAATASLPNSIAFSQINGTGSLNLRPPSIYFINGTV